MIWDAVIEAILVCTKIQRSKQLDRWLEEWSGGITSPQREYSWQILDRWLGINIKGSLFSEYTELQEIKTDLNVNLKEPWYAR